MNREDLVKIIDSEVLSTSEVIEILECTRQNLAKLNKSGSLVPVKKLSRENLYLKCDVIAYDEKRKGKSKK